VGGQTREHVQLARSLGVERVIVAVSKVRPKLSTLNPEPSTAIPGLL